MSTPAALTAEQREALGDLAEGLLAHYPIWYAKKLAEGKDLSGLPVPATTPSAQPLIKRKTGKRD
jgi:hypothetical protein